MDRTTNDIYIADQEALADIGFGKLNTSNSLTSACANAPAVTADRPFQALIPTGNQTTPVSKADGNGAKAISYISYLCDGCGPTAPNGPVGLAYGWSDDAVTYHPAEPGQTVPNNNLGLNNMNEATTINLFQWHGPMVADPVTGTVYTALSCNGSCGLGTTPAGNQVGVVVGKPYANPATDKPANMGEFQTLTYEPAALALPAEGSLFPVLTMDSARTLYLLWTEGQGGATTSLTPPQTSWHIYYTYSKVDANGNHPTWSSPVQVDVGGQTATSPVSIMGWMVAGDPGKVGFIWLQANKLTANHREHPSFADTAKQWFVNMAVSTNGDSASPTFQQAQVGLGPNHISDVCLQGTVGCIQNVGNRNMADFISVDIGLNGQLQGTWANDSNRLSTAPTTLIPGLPITETAVQVSGPALIGAGNIGDSRFSTIPTTQGLSDATGDGLNPVSPAANVKQLDLTNSKIEWTGNQMVVHISANDLATMNSPDQTHPHVWWLTTWQFNHQIYFAKVEWDSLPAGGAIACTAGVPKTFDRPGLNAQTVATLADYSAGTSVAGCVKSGNEFKITVPTSVVGSPNTGDVLESVAGFTVLDNGAPPAVGPGPGNVPSIYDATPAYDALLVVAPAPGIPESPFGPLILIVGTVAALLFTQRRRARTHLGASSLDPARAGPKRPARAN